jgi:iron uptake system component EfeO
MSRKPGTFFALAVALLVGGCGSDDDGPAANAGDAGDASDDVGGADAGTPGSEGQALTSVKAYIASNLDTLAAAADELQRAAPAPDADGWSNTTDAAAVDAMKAAWRKARQSYEHIEGAIAVLFPELDVSTDERYDGFVEMTGDDNLFDGEGVTGIHAIERILWSAETRMEVITFEKGLAKYQPAAFPKTLQQADDFKNKLCVRLVTDLGKMRADFRPLKLDKSAAYRGVIGSIAEQIEKISKAETGEEESRYANETLNDMRFNIEGGIATQKAFEPWLLTVPGGAALAAKIDAGFARIATALGTGAQLPPVPSTWTAANPSPVDLATPFGMLYALLKKESDGKNADSLVSAMSAAAAALGINALPD